MLLLGDFSSSVLRSHSSHTHIVTVSVSVTLTAITFFTSIRTADSHLFTHITPLLFATLLQCTYSSIISSIGATVHSRFQMLSAILFCCLLQINLSSIYPLSHFLLLLNFVVGVKFSSIKVQELLEKSRVHLK